MELEVLVAMKLQADLPEDKSIMTRNPNDYWMG